MLWDIGTIVTAVALIWAAYEFRKNLQINKMERTFNVFPTIREEYFDLKKRTHKNGELTQDGEKLLREYLSKMERFSVGVHCNIYDVSIINRMSGRVLIEQYNGFIREYIVKRTEKGMVDTTYCEYEKLIQEITDLRTKKK